MKRLLYLLALGLVGMVAVAVYREIESRTSVAPSKVQLAPAELQDVAYRLPLATGGALSSDELEGGPVILNFWASWCDACKSERPELEKLKELAQDRILGIGTQDTKDKLVAYDTAHPHGYRILIDEDGDVAAKFQVSGLPHTFLIGRDGKVLARVVGTLKPADSAELARLYEAELRAR